MQCIVLNTQSKIFFLTHLQRFNLPKHHLRTIMDNNIFFKNSTNQLGKKSHL